MVHGIEEHDLLHPRFEQVHGVEQRSGVGPSRDEDLPDVEDVAEEHAESREQEAQSHAEEHDEQQEDGQQDDLPGGKDLEVDHDADGRDKREDEVD